MISNTHVTVAIAVLSVLMRVGTATAADFTPGNVVVLRVGNGNPQALAVATQVSLLELNPANGSVVQTISLNFAGGGPKLTQYGFSLMTQGFLSRSDDGASLYLSGFNAAAGTASVNLTGASTTIARVGVNAVPDLSSSITSFGNNLGTGAAGVNTTRFWATSDYVNNTAPRIVTALTGTSGAGTTVIAGSSTSACYAPRVINGQLYVTDFNGALARTATPLPTGASSTIPVVQYNLGTGGLEYPGEYVFLDRSAGVAGLDTLYMAGLNGIQKFSFDGAAWTARGTANVGGDFFGLAGTVTGSNATLYATTGDGTVVNNQFGRFIDTAAFNANISASFTSLSTAGTNYNFYGLAFAPTPVPEPALALSLTAMALITWRRLRRS